MTQEQKAKAYDEALEWMRKVYPTLTGADKEDAEHYFPELKESEEEKARKWIYDYIRNCPNNNFEFYGGVGKDAVLNYLEKQKEQDKCPEYCVRSHCIGCSIYEKKKEQKPYEPKNWPADKNNFTQEQKPAEWSEEDEALYTAFMCEVVNEKMNPTIEQIKWLRGIRDRLKSLRPRKQARENR